MEGGQVRIFADGEVQDDSAEKFKAFVRIHGIKNARVHLNSPGGSLIGGLLLGAAIRDLDFDTKVQAKGWEYGKPANSVCASACAYTFAGGVNRYYSDEAGRLGVHQFYSDGKVAIGAGEAQSMSGLLVAYLQRMGVDPATFALASVTKSNEILVFSQRSGGSGLSEQRDSSHDHRNQDRSRPSIPTARARD